MNSLLTGSSVLQQGKRRRTRQSAGVAVTGLALIGGLIAGAGAAHAADDNWYDPSALLTSCQQNVDGLGKADRCRFEPAKRTVFTGPERRVGSTVHACGTPVTMGRQTTEGHTEENSISVSATVEAGLSKMFAASITTQYGHSWSYSTSETEEITAEVPQYSIAFATIAPAMQRVEGRMVINYPKRRHGHFEWYAYPTLTQYSPEEMQYASVSVQTRPMTNAERNSICSTTASVSAPPATRTTVHLAKQGFSQGVSLSAKPKN